MKGSQPIIFSRPATRTLVAMIVRRLPWTLLMVTVILLVTTVTADDHSFPIALSRRR